MKLRRSRAHRPAGNPTLAAQPSRRADKTAGPSRSNTAFDRSLAAATDEITADLVGQGTLDIDGSMLERARTLWQVGDWQALAALANEPLENHPLRAKLAILVATALHQLGRFEDAAAQIEQAEAWGLPRHVLIRALLAGALNSVGRAHALRGRPNRAADNYSQALAIGFPGSEHRSTVQARVNEQNVLLGLAAGNDSSPVLTLPSRCTSPAGANAVVPDAT